MTDKTDAINLLHAFEAFRDKTGSNDYFAFFFGIALGSMSYRVHTEELIAAIEKLRAKDKPRVD